MAIQSRPFGRTGDGTPVTCWTITNCGGGYVSVLDYGCILQAIAPALPDREPIDVVMGFSNPAGYEAAGGFIGATVGRCANRIIGGCFRLHGRSYPLFCNEGKNHLHGGRIGFSKRMWTVTPGLKENSLQLTLFSPDGEEGYPGNLWVHVTLTFTDSNELYFDTDAVSDADTVFNLTNHSYFDLNGRFTEASACAQTLWADAPFYTPVDTDGLVDGTLRPTAGTVFDFSRETALAPRLAQENVQLDSVGGFDHNLVFAPGDGPKAVLRGLESGLRMEFFTASPGMQLYSGNYLRVSTGKGSTPYGRRSGICLEPQFFPNSINLPQFPAPVLQAHLPYHNRTLYRFCAE